MVLYHYGYFGQKDSETLIFFSTLGLYKILEDERDGKKKINNE